MRQTFFKNVRLSIGAISLSLILFLILSSFVPGSEVMAAVNGSGSNYNSWIRGTTSDPGGAQMALGIEKEDKDVVNEAPDDEKPNTVEKILAQMVGSIGTMLRKAFQGNNHIDGSTTGIIMGHITNGSSFFVFDLKDDSLWGQVGAVIYVGMRAIALASLFVIILARTLIPLWKGNSRGGEIVKNALITFVLSVFVITTMPMVADWICEVRDFLGVQLYEMVSLLVPTSGRQFSYSLPVIGKEVSVNFDKSLGNTIEGVYYDVYRETPNMVNAIVYLMVSALPLMFMFDYIRLAIVQTGLFGLFPLFGAMGALDGGKSVKDWVITFATNALVPCIDMVFIFTPALLVDKITESGDINPNNLIILIALVLCFWGVIPARNKILSMLGATGGFGLDKGSTLGGLLANAGKSVAAVAGAVAGAVSEYKSGTQGASHSEMQQAETAEKSLSDNMNPKASDSSVIEGGVSDSKVLDKAGEIAEGNESAGGSSNTEAQGSQEDNIIKQENDEQSDANEHNFTTNESVGMIGEDGNNTLEVENSVIGGEGGSEDSAAESVTNNNYAMDSTEKLISDNTVSKSDMEKEAAENGNSLAAQINQNSYVGGKGEKKVDHRDFNTSRAANLATIDKMNGSIKNYDKSNASLAKDNAQLKKTMDENRKSLNRLYESKGLTRDENGNFNKQAIEDLKATDSSFRDAANSYTSAINSARDKIADNNTTIADNNANKAVLQGEVAKRKEVEQEFADRYAQTGRSGQTFSSAQEFSNHLEQESRARDIADLSNYKELHAQGYLSDQQRMQFQRKAAARELAGKALTGAGTVAVGAALTPLALASGDERTASSIMRTARPIASAAGKVTSVGAQGAASVASRVEDSYTSHMTRRMQASTPRYRKARLVSENKPVEVTHGAEYMSYDEQRVSKERTKNYSDEQNNRE